MSILTAFCPPLPSDLSTSTYTLYIFAESWFKEHMFDYISRIKIKQKTIKKQLNLTCYRRALLDTFAFGLSTLCRIKHENKINKTFLSIHFFNHSPKGFNVFIYFGLNTSEQAYTFHFI